MNYFNEHDPKAAAWIQQLIDDKQIPYGYVDTRSILEVEPSDLRGFTQCHFFAGIGGWSLALRLAGWPPSRPVWTASLPCQSFSTAGKQRGTEDERHLWPVFERLVRECRPPRIFGEQVASKLARTDWLPGVCLDLQALGYSATAVDLCSPCSGEIGEGWIVRGDQGSWERIIIGQPHIRQRLYWVAHLERQGLERSAGACLQRDGVGPAINGSNSDLESLYSRMGDSRIERPQGHAGDEFYRSEPRRQHQEPTGSTGSAGGSDIVLLPCRDGKTRRTQLGIFPLAPGFPRGVVPSGDPNDPSYANATAEGRAVRLKGYGNAIQIDTAKLFIETCMEVIDA